MQVLCCLDVQGDHAMDMAQQFITESHESPEVLAAVRTMLREVYAMTEQCDELLVRHARHWGLSRLALIDRNILRLGVYELLAGQTSARVIITEALKLAKEFSTAESPKFVNGILDAVYKELATEAGHPLPGGRDEAARAAD